MASFLPHTSTSGSRGLAGGLLALALLAGGGAVLSRPGPAVPEVPALDTLEDCSTAEVVLLGNSKTRSDLPADELAAQLDLSPDGVSSLTVHGSSGPVWYAVVENKVFGAGCRPRTVVAYGTLDKLLAGDVSPDERLRLLVPVMSKDEPVLRRKLPGLTGEATGWGRARQRALELREGLLGGIAAGTVGLLAHPGISGRGLLDEASDALFGEYFAAAPPPSIPLPQGDAAPSVAPPAQAADSLLPDLLALCAAHGARLVVVRAPLLAAWQEREVLEAPGLVAGARSLVEQGGGAWVDLSDIPFTAGDWGDDVHLGPLGASRLTWHVARALGGRAAEAVRLLDAPPRFTAEPPPVALRSVHPESERYLSLHLDGHTPLSDEACTEHEVARCCSPLVVTRDGVLLPHTTRAEVEQGHGWYHAEVGVLAASGGDGELALGLDPSRHCGGWWLYPGDRATLGPSAPLPGPTTLSLRLRVADEAPAGTLTVRLTAGEIEVLTAEVPLATGLLRWPLAPVPGVLPLTLELTTSPDASFALFTEATITSTAPKLP
ncbi:MAG: hypothetical protein ABIO70_29345 [Pseudomonadota bacterium]